MKGLTQKQMLARAEAYREAADHLLLNWTEDEEERSQGDLIAFRLKELEKKWLDRAGDSLVEQPPLASALSCHGRITQSK